MLLGIFLRTSNPFGLKRHTLLVYRCSTPQGLSDQAFLVVKMARNEALIVMHLPSSLRTLGLASRIPAASLAVPPGEEEVLVVLVLVVEEGPTM